MSRLLHQLLSDSAALTPDAIALIAGNQSLSYRSLDEACRQFAIGLQQRGVVRNDRIAIYLPKQIEMVVSLIGASMAGGVFVPVNPVLKAAQVRHIIDDCAATVLVTSKPRLALLRHEIAASASI